MKRVLTAIVALPILLYSIWSHNPYLFVGLATVVGILALYEFIKLAGAKGPRPTAPVAYAGLLLVFACFTTGRLDLIVAVLSGVVILSLALELLRPRQLDQALVASSTTLLGVVYIGVLAGFLVGLRLVPDRPDAVNLAPRMLSLFIAIVMMTDTGAFYSGRTFGRHKLAPAISPGKTIEGSIGGFVAALAAGPICHYTFFPALPILDAVILGGVLSIVSQVGDLAESLLKRGSGIKDSSTMLPGHGGFLDRLDSILFTAPLIYYYAQYFLNRH